MKTLLLGGVALVAMTASAYAEDHCADGKTLEDGVLTFATSDPAYSPWVLDNAPESGKGFEAAFAKELATHMGFEDSNVKWVRANFDQSIQPGPKDFDLNLQQFSITEERDQVVDFSEAYYDAPMAVVVLQPAIDDGVTADLESLRPLKWGAHAATTAPKSLADLVQPESDPLLYDDTANVVEAMKANQIDAAIFDLPTALYVTAALVDNGVVVGQFPSNAAETPDQFGILMEEGSALKPCVDEAVISMKDDGTLEELQTTWLSDETGIPVIEITEE